jgi:hypothetical protein
MTQDPHGQPPGTGYVVRGEVAPDDGADETPPTAPMTQFQKVASALHGDRTDPAIPAYVATDAATTTSQDTQDAAQDDASRDATRPEEVVAVRSPDAGSPDYWDDAAEHAVPEEAALEEAIPDEPAAAGADAAGAAAGADAAGAAGGADAATQDPTMTQPDLYAAERAEAPVAGAGQPEVVGKHAETPAQEGLRPGESGHGLDDFSDLTFGSLLPDAAEFKAQWQQVQFRFVDDPPGSVTEAADVVAQVTAKLEAAIAERQRAIAERQRALRSRWSEGKSTDTESLRETLLMYRAFLDQLTGPKDG